MGVGIETETTHRALSLPEAPKRWTRAEAEADEKRGRELKAFLALVPGISVENWESAERAAQGADSDYSLMNEAHGRVNKALDENGLFVPVNSVCREARRSTTCPSRVGTWIVEDSVLAIAAREFISREHFDVLTAPLGAAGIDFDALVAM